MKTILVKTFLMISMLMLGNPFCVSSQTDTIKEIPFLETWDSASFSTNNWTFPWGQGNWTILTGQGNPPPCAAFTGSPSQSNYIFALVSPWFDATGLTCDQIYLDFNNSSNNESYSDPKTFAEEMMNSPRKFV